MKHKSEIVNDWSAWEKVYSGCSVAWDIRFPQGRQIDQIREWKTMPILYYRNTPGPRPGQYTLMLISDGDIFRYDHLVSQAWITTFDIYGYGDGSKHYKTYCSEWARIYKVFPGCNLR